MLKLEILRSLSPPVRLFSSAACLMFLSACGGSSSTPTTPSVPCIQTAVLQGTGLLPANTADFETFTTTATGRVDVMLDWTLSSTVMGLAVSQNPCTFDQLKANSCTLLLNTMSPPKPLKGSIPNVSAGTYVLIVANTNSVDESFSLKVVLNTGSCPAPSSGLIQSQSLATGIVGSMSHALQD